MVLTIKGRYWPDSIGKNIFALKSVFTLNNFIRIFAGKDTKCTSPTHIYLFQAIVGGSIKLGRGDYINQGFEGKCLNIKLQVINIDEVFGTPVGKVKSHQKSSDIDSTQVNQPNKIILRSKDIFFQFFNLAHVLAITINNEAFC